MIFGCSPSPVNTANEIKLHAITNEMLRAPVIHPISSTIRAEAAIHQGLKLLTVYAKESKGLIKVMWNWLWFNGREIGFPSKVFFVRTDSSVSASWPQTPAA